MKYEKEIKTLIKSLIHAEDMAEKEFEKFLPVFLEFSGTSIQQLSDEIEIGVKNGVPAEMQFDLVKALVDKS